MKTHLSILFLIHKAYFLNKEKAAQFYKLGMAYEEQLHTKDIVVGSNSPLKCSDVSCPLLPISDLQTQGDRSA